MNEFERKLLEYRSRERRKQQIDRWKHAFGKSVALLTNILKPKREHVISRNGKVNQHPELPAIEEKSSTEWETSDSASILDSESETDDMEKPLIQGLNWCRIFQYIVVWTGMFAYAVYIEFGAVFILLSGFYFIWTNTRTEPRKPDEISAYSVFNPNCERIQGTLDAETLEKEMKYGFIV